MVKKILTMVLVAVFMASILVQPALADQKKGYGKGGYGLEGKFCKMGRRIIKNKKELGLTDKQEKEVKSLLKATKKSLIKQDAEIKTLKVEINTLMWEAPFDVDAVNEFVAGKYDLKSKKAQYIISAMNKMHNILTAEQLEKLNSLR